MKEAEEKFDIDKNPEDDEGLVWVFIIFLLLLFVAKVFLNL